VKSVGLLVALLGAGALTAEPPIAKRRPEPVPARSARPYYGRSIEPRFCCGIASRHGDGQRRRLRQRQPIFVRPTHAEQKRPERALRAAQALDLLGELFGIPEMRELARRA